MTCQFDCPATFAIFVNSARSGIAVPWLLYTLMPALTVVPVAASAGRLPPTLMLPVVIGLMICPTGIFRCPTAPVFVTFPVWSACQPWTNPPSAVTRLPLASSEKLPLRVNSDLPAMSMVKKPSPWIAKSVDRPVSWVAPCAKFTLTPVSRTPRPTCDGLVPPRVGVGKPAPLSCWLNKSSNKTVLVL